MKMYEEGISVKDIAAKLTMSYSAVYHWVKGLRKPDTGNLNDFENHLKKGPVAAAEIKDKFPKHNELFLTASKRGISIKRVTLGRKYGDYSTWYFLDGQEDILKEKVKELFKKYREVKEKLIKTFGVIDGR